MSPGSAPPPDGIARYHRQAILPSVGEAGQRKLAASHAMIVGLGALGCPAADLLTRAGVGRISLVDRDVVEWTNLQRQTLYDERDAREATPKAEAAVRRLRAVNSAVRLEALVEDCAGPDAERLVAPHPRPDVLLDCTDNFATRYTLNDVATKLGIPLVYGGAVGTTGMAMTIVPIDGPHRTACLRCLFPDAPAPGSTPTCDTAGIFGPVAAIIGAAQAADALKVLLGRFDALSGTLLSFDLWANHRQRLDVRSARRADCPCCGDGARRYEFLEGANHGSAVTLCGRNSVQVTPARGGGPARVDLAALAARLAPHGRFDLGEHALRGRLEAPPGVELTVFADGRAIIGGTTDPVAARTLYARYIGA